MRTFPWDKSPADMETRLLLAMDSLEYELGCPYFLERDGELPAGRGLYWGGFEVERKVLQRFLLPRVARTRLNRLR
jgi:hypothetical protein